MLVEPSLAVAQAAGFLNYASTGFLPIIFFKQLKCHKIK